MTGKIEIDIFCRDPRWPDFHKLAEIACHEISQKIGCAGELSLVLADDIFIQDLNRNYREKNSPTNVLSFPQNEPGLLGDVIFAFETIYKEAKDQEKSFESHFTHLLIHGILHLVGYDHETEEEAEEMEALEARILQGLGIKNPYESEQVL